MNTSHYPSLELCKKLTYVGFPETEENIYDEKSIREAKISPFNIIAESLMSPYKYVCPSVMEMIDIIPDSIHDKIGQKKWLEIGKKFVAYSTNGMAVHMVDGHIPNALAEMTLWLHENSYISFTK